MKLIRSSKCSLKFATTSKLQELRKVLSEIAQQPQPESVTGSVPHRSCKGCPEYGLDRDCSGKCP